MHHLLPNRNFEHSPPAVFPPLDAVAWGFDFYGLWKNLEIAGVQQRMRWIPPGEFLMGSPEDEPERGSEELQHRVQLTDGFWLADTPCTQELWQAVTGGNPSHFKGEQRPVESVSWDDADDFLQKIIKDEPLFDLKQPTEAQWEYACRAGTETPFNVGNNINPDIVNYDGHFPYRGGEKGESRNQTVEVLEEGFEANRWGLWQMHGNVWEWCSDWYGDYESIKIAVDPTGPKQGGRRVLRGGGWFDSARSCRSAYRYAGGPSGRDYDVGFRFVQADQPRSDSR